MNGFECGVITSNPERYKDYFERVTNLKLKLEPREGLGKDTYIASLEDN